MFVDYSILWKRAVHHVYMHMYMYMLHAGARPLRQQELHHLVERRQAERGTECSVRLSGVRWADV